MKKIILIIGILALLVSCDMPNNDSSNTDVSNQTDTTSETTNKEDETPSSESEEEIKKDGTSENEENGNEISSPIEDDSTSESEKIEEDNTSESEETNYSNEFIVSSDVTWEEVYGDYVSYVHYNNDDNTQSIKYGVSRNMSTNEFLFLNVTVTIYPSNTSSWIRTNLTVYFMENDELKFISSNTSILIENVCINKENKEVHIYLIDKN